jgi:hypothetical protein
LPGHYRRHGGASPRHRASYDQTSGHDDVPQARLFLCAVPACRTQVLICRDCDRGHIYCGECAPTARQRSLRRAGRRYQASARGRIRHAARSRQYRLRKNKVTHHGSPADPTGAVLTAGPGAVVEEPVPMNSEASRRPSWCCLCCGRRCSEHVRQDFLPRRVRRNRRRGPVHDHPA